MKAAVLHAFGDIPRFEDFPDPVAKKEEVLINVKAVPLENIDKLMSEGRHFASKQFLSTLPAIVGFDGIGELPNGQLVGFGGTTAPYGAMAEMTVVPKENTIPIPEGINAVIASALPASALTSLFPLQWGAKIQPGETVLVNGATGVAGKLAVQIAKLLGAGRVIGTGRNLESLKRIKELGADDVIHLQNTEEQIQKAFKEKAENGYDIILDFIWGKPTEILIKTFIPEQIGYVGKNIRLIQIGEAAGNNISLPAKALRNSGLEIIGASKGLTPEAMSESTNQVWKWIKENKLTMDINEVPLKDIEKAWRKTDFKGERIVIIP